MVMMATVSMIIVVGMTMVIVVGMSMTGHLRFEVERWMVVAVMVMVMEQLMDQQSLKEKEQNK